MTARRMARPVIPGDRVFVRGVRLSTPGDERVYEVVAEVLAVDAQGCGCWRNGTL